MRYLFLRLLAVALVTLGLAAAPALAVPATVRIAGDQIGGSTIVNTRPGPVEGTDCVGGSAADALDVATAHNWDLQPFISTIFGETHSYANRDWWTFWVNGEFSQTGACDYIVQPGDELLFYVQKDNDSFMGTIFPLYLTGVPAAVTAGQPFTVRVMRHTSDGSTTVRAPLAGATVTDGAGATATTGADGTATLTLTTPGTARLQASAPQSVSSPLATVAVNPAPVVAAPTPPEPEAPAPVTPVAPSIVAPVEEVDRTAPVAQLTGLRKHFAHRRGPRTLRGTVADDGAIKQVEIRLKRKRGKRCSAFSASRERFVKRSCKRGAPWFDVGSEASWSYLLPERLGRGLYQLQTRATDQAGNRSTNTSVWFRVR